MTAVAGAARLRWALLPLASVAVFWLLSAWLDPGLLGRHPFPRPLDASERDGVLLTLDATRRIYADFFSSGGAPALLDDFPATKAVKHRIFRDIGFLRDRGLLQIQDLAEAIPMRLVRTGEETAEALVYEEWNWMLQRAADRAPVTTVKGMGGGFRYVLRHAPDGRWVVASWEPEDVQRPATPPEFKY